MSDEFDSEDDYIYDKLNESLAEKAKQRNDHPSDSANVSLKRKESDDDSVSVKKQKVLEDENYDDMFEDDEFYDSILSTTFNSTMNSTMNEDNEQATKEERPVTKKDNAVEEAIEAENVVKVALQRVEEQVKDEDIKFKFCTGREPALSAKSEKIANRLFKDINVLATDLELDSDDLVKDLIQV